MQRMTKQRRIILEELKKVKTHPTATEIYLAVRKRIPNISLGTIYRNLEVLCKEGKIQKLVCENFKRFDGNSVIHPHFFCEICGKVFDMDYYPELNEKEIERKTGNEILRINIDAYGLCKNCRGKKID